MSGEQRPVLRIVRGNPDDDELAALTAVVAAASLAPAPPASDEPRSRWADRARSLRQPLHPGAGSWRASAFPR
ncbi:acyl-CoA carboxylase subunit epsilon [Amycolatopsis sp. GM8]|uniref:acyl-CoA carboxylase subunit epsilon n=1 Tax=Amycolatopsis sp. GM8 TaxID=2896530 RepID=UPI001F2C0C30|nr:acyl-CoA carboxylase subunit epsilon [Amycolatopsis sp. GM8]